MVQRASSSRVLSGICLVIIWVFWGSTFLGQAAAIKSAPPFIVSMARYLSAAPLFLVLAWPSYRRSDDRVTLPQIRSAILVGTMLFLGSNGLVVFGQTRLDSGLSALINAITPIWMTLIVSGITRKAPRARSIASFILAIAGLGVMVGGPGDSMPLLYVGITVIASFFWASGTVAARYLPMPHNPFLNSSIQMFGGGTALAIVAWMRGDFARVTLSEISRNSWLGWAWLVIGGSLIGYSAYVYANEHLPIELVGTYAYVNPVIAVFLGWLLLHEPIGPRVLIGGAMILVAVFIVVSGQVTPRRRLRAHRAKISAHTSR